jgi:putative transposase
VFLDEDGSEAAVDRLAARVRLVALGAPVDVRLSVADGGPGCACDRDDARAGGSVPALWLSADSDLLEACRPCDEHGPDASALAPGGAPGARGVVPASPSGHRPSTPLPRSGANQVWAYDFVFDTCANGQQLKCLTVIDEWTREFLAIDVAGGIRSGRVIEVLAQLVSVHGAPRYLRSDNGPEFVVCAILQWLHEAGIETALIDPAKPWQNGADEWFNGTFRDEFLTLQWFRNRVDAKVGTEQWRRHYNEVRPHSSLGYLTPLEFKTSCAASFTEGRSPAMPARADQEEHQRRPECEPAYNPRTPGSVLVRSKRLTGRHPSSR